MTNAPFLSWGNTQTPTLPMDPRTMGIPGAGGGMPDSSVWSSLLNRSAMPDTSAWSSLMPDMQAGSSILPGGPFPASQWARQNSIGQWNQSTPGADIETPTTAWDGFKGWMGKQSLGDIAQGLGALGGMWQSSKGLGLAKENLNFQREAFNTNLNNSIQSYNTRLEDRIRGRSANPNENDVRSYLDKHSLGRG